MARTVVTSTKHLEELAPTPAKLSKLTGYDTLDPDETRAYIAEVLRVYSKQNKPYKIRSRRNPISDFKTTWKIKHDGKHIGDINLETHKPHGVGFGYGISKGIIKHEQRRWYTAHVKMVAHHVKARIDVYFKVGVWWDIRGIPSSIQARKKWYVVYQEVKSLRQDRRTKAYRLGTVERDDVRFEITLEETLDHLQYAEADDFFTADVPVYRRSTIKKIIVAGDAGNLDHMKSY